MRMASACALTIAGMPTPATSAEPAAPLTSVRRDNLEFMAIPPFEDIRADCAGQGRRLRRPIGALAATFASKYRRAAYQRCPADSLAGGRAPLHRRAAHLLPPSIVSSRYL